MIIGLIEKKYNNSPRECCIHSSFYRIINITKVIKKKDQSWKDCLFYLYDYLTELENKVIRSILNISNVSNEEAENFIKFYIREQNLNGGESIHECLERLKLRNKLENKNLPYIQILTNDEKYKKEMEKSDLNKYIYFGKYQLVPKQQYMELSIMKGVWAIVRRSIIPMLIIIINQTI